MGSLGNFGGGSALPETSQEWEGGAGVYMKVRIIADESNQAKVSHDGEEIYHQE